MGTIVVSLILLAIVASIIAFMIKEKKAGRHPSCGGNCASCGGACHCSGHSCETEYQSEEKPIKI
ncbi:MAG: FeoB-associated Cys-rich membrane protein [Treponema sp.]|nr:FeoB-associated Cys-rich membrane protein [Treponema sp.]